MRALLQRVLRGHVAVNGEIISKINKGYVILLGVGKNDTEKDADSLASKILDLRLFPDGEKENHLSIRDVGGELLVVSQFTLYGDVRKGRRPSFDQAMPGPEAKKLYEFFVERLRKSGLTVATGVFGAMMEVELVNWGPYTIWIETP
ncbi:D-aminoacyl-tRNA deacylase [Thermospira aquatica]|uniref:D-aminoacyl-tRNA deacylase n=1 Tax=Thermospira aquatica TaxID=2828656 RepID=A0AAX3BEJ2_9SPIR|nr:D-aminoacyl-tRNA deacylase [Thermospira aquatica]URA10646.1 D-tyrosyl-tRNA(Tyr) deacylase [Thermospira aquatica]